MSADGASELVLVYTTGSIMEGYLVKGRLEVEGIPVLMKGGEGPYRTGPVDLYVSKEDEPDARTVLEAATVAEDDEELADVPSLNGDEPAS